MTKIEDKVRKDILKLENTLNTVSGYSDLMVYAEMNHLSIFVDIDGKVIITARRYEDLLALKKEALKYEKMEYSTTWFSCGDMNMSWEGPLIKVWFSCKPEDFPKELLPSKECTLKETVSQKSSWAITCPVKE